MKDKVRKIISITILTIMIFGFLYIGNKEYEQEKSLTDHEKFAQEYPTIPSDNVFNYLTHTELEEFLKNGTGILFLATPSSIWSSPYAQILNELAKEEQINEIHYYNITYAKETGNRYYQNLISELKDHLITTDDSNVNLFTPMLIFVKKGEVIATDNETAIMQSDEKPTTYWQTAQKLAFKNKIKLLIPLVKEVT